jgi:hypothetical protein
MQTLRRVALVLALAGGPATLPGCAVAQPLPPSPSYYGDGGGQGIPGAWEQDLAPYGSWQNLPQYGNVWYPNVAPGWRPYTYGYWGSSPAGWAWFSSEPWGFTFNYGRWAYAPIGWVWVPGTVWGPAWVNWYWGNGYVGWAPLGYYSAVPWAQFVFVRDYDFGCRNVNGAYYNHPPKGGGYHHGAPPRSYIDRVAHRPVVRVSASQLPNRSFQARRTGVPRGQAPGQSAGRPGTAMPGRPQGNGQIAGRPPVPGGAAPTPQYGAPRSPAFTARPQGAPYSPSFSARPQPGAAAPRPYQPGTPRGNAPAQGSPYGHAPQARPPQAPVPQAPAPRGNAPQMHPYVGMPRAVPAPAAPPSSQGYRPSTPMPQAAPPPAAPSGQFNRMPVAPSTPGFTGGGRGFGPGRGYSSPGMR